MGLSVTRSSEGGQQTQVIEGSDSNLPTYVRPELKKWLPDLKLILHLLGGTRLMHENATTYIRMWSDEDPRVYLIRSRLEQVFEGLTRTLSAAIGMLFAKPPEIEWNAGETIIQEHWDNIDGAGTKGSVFVKRFTETAIRDGVGIILVDHPSAPKDEEGNPIQVTADNEKEFGLRPTWARYDRANARSWLTGKKNNQEILTQLVLYEPAYVQDGEYGVRYEHRWRVLRLVQGKAAWGLLALIDGKSGSEKEDFKVLGEGFFLNKNGQAAPFLPVAIAYTGKKEGPMVSSPPLLGVAWANLGHWQISTNLRFYLDLACFPQPTVIGDLAMEQGLDQDGNRVAVPGVLRAGPMVAVHLSSGTKDSGPADYRFTVPPPDGFEPNERAIQRKKEDIAALGMSFLDRDKRAAETAEAKRLDATAENATLATSAQGVDDAVNEAFRIHGWYLGIENKECPQLQLNRDFEATTMDPQTMMAWIAGVDKVKLPTRLLLEAWMQGGQIPEGTDLEELELEMAAEEEARKAEEEAQREIEAETRRVEMEEAAAAGGAKRSEEEEV